MKNDSGPHKPVTGGKASTADNRVAQRHQKQAQAAQLSAANVEESPHMDRGDSAGGSGESLGAGRESAKAAEALAGGAVDTQYGTKSSLKSAPKSGPGGRATSAGSAGSAGSGPSDSEETRQAPNPGSSEKSSGAERDTMTSGRPGSRS